MRILKFILTLLILSTITFTAGCSENEVNHNNLIMETQTEDETSFALRDQKEQTNDLSRFTIQADEALKPSIRLLYQSFYPNETAFFVDLDGDLIATQDLPIQDERPVIYATFLPGAILIPKVELEDITEFLNFSISINGQQVLIDAGMLPDQISIYDQLGNQIVIPQPVKRVISAYGPTTAMVYSIGASDRLVAASFLGARDPQGAAAMERIDSRFQDLESDDYFSQQEFNLEQAALLEPDLIIASARSTWVENASQLGLNVFLIEAETTSQLKEAILLIGQLFGPHASAQAVAWTNYYDWVLNSILNNITQKPGLDKPRILFTGTEPLRIASGEMYQTEIIEAAGGISVSGDLHGYWNDVNLEQVAVWDPDIVLVPPYGGASVSAIIDSPEWQILTAVQHNSVYQMPKLVAPWDTPTPDSVLGIVWLSELFYKDIIDGNCAEEVTYFYNNFYNYDIGTDEIAKLCDIQ